MFTQNIECYRIDGEGPLNYWYDNTWGFEYQYNTLELLLQNRNGTCVAWADLFKQLLSLQGIDCTVCTILANPFGSPEYDNKPYKGFLQKPVAVQGEDSALRILDLGESGKAFGMHKIVKYVNSANQTLYYDPGTGGGPYTSWQDYVTLALDFWFGNNPCVRVPTVDFYNPSQYFIYSEVL